MTPVLRFPPPPPRHPDVARILAKVARLQEVRPSAVRIIECIVDRLLSDVATRRL